MSLSFLAIMTFHFPLRIWLGTIISHFIISFSWFTYHDMVQTLWQELVEYEKKLFDCLVFSLFKRVVNTSSTINVVFLTKSVAMSHMISINKEVNKIIVWSSSSILISTLNNWVVHLLSLFTWSLTTILSFIFNSSNYFKYNLLLNISTYNFFINFSINWNEIFHSKHYILFYELDLNE